MSSRLCSICNGIFNRRQVLRKEFPHHQKPDDFIIAAKEGCYICKTITTSHDWKMVSAIDPIPEAIWCLTPRPGREAWLRLTIEMLKSGLVTTTSSDLQDEDEVINKPATQDDDNWYPAWSFSLQTAEDVSSDVSLDCPPSGFEDPNLMQLALSWFSHCTQNHPRCTLPNPLYRPTRLVQLLPGARFRLLIGQEAAKADSYSAFSHCWGKAKTIKLTQHSLADLSAGCLVEDLPTSYKEAIKASMALGIEHIWIDSLCILQESVTDWRHEAARMSDIYGNATLTICASAAAENSQSSFATRDLSLIPPVQVAAQWNEAEPIVTEAYFLVNEQSYETDVVQSPLASRAWAAQESYLATRKLCLTERQLWWVCKHVFACEAYPGGFPPSMHTYSTHNSPKWDPATWCDLVGQYSDCALTVPTDKLVAFSGFARDRLERLQTGKKYVAGLWQEELPLALCWRTSETSPAHRPDVYIAPSWSWASIDGNVSFSDVVARRREDAMVEELCSVSNCFLQLVDSAFPTGPLETGSIDIHGHIIGPVSMEPPDNALEFFINMQGQRINLLEKTNWDYDEKTEARDDMISYLDLPHIKSTPVQDWTAAMRKSSPDLQSEGLQLFCLPIWATVAEDGERWGGGLLLCHKPSQPDSIYHRVGSFRFDDNSMDTALLSSIPQRTITLL